MLVFQVIQHLADCCRAISAGASKRIVNKPFSDARIKDRSAQIPLQEGKLSRLPTYTCGPKY
jgi:hypothetical protein